MASPTIHPKPQGTRKRRPAPGLSFFNSCFYLGPVVLRKTACFFALVKWPLRVEKKRRKKYTRGTGGAPPSPSFPPVRLPLRPESPGPHVAEAASRFRRTSCHDPSAFSWVSIKLGDSAVYTGCAVPHLSPLGMHVVVVVWWV
jgi:hypothetical protein